MIKVVGLLLLLVVISCGSDDKSIEAPKSKQEDVKVDGVMAMDSIPEPAMTSQNLSCEIIEVDSGYGYNILLDDGKPMIKQHHIPGIQGLKVFDSKEEAKKVAELVKYKLENNIMPPSVTLNELDSLNISY